MRRLAWARLDTNGRDEAEVVRTEDGIVVSGRSTEPRYDLSYRLHYDAEWNVREAEARDLRTGQRLRLFRDGEAWLEETAPRPDLLGCTTVDLGCTPFTNTPPLLQVALAPKATLELEVAHLLPLPRLHAVRARQRYTNLGGGRVRYEGLDTGFEAVLTLDVDGWVQEYPGLFRRVA